MKRLLALTGVIGALGVLAWAQVPDAVAQETDIENVVVRISAPGGQDLPIALPPPKGDGSVSDTVWEVVRRDLEMSGFFTVIDPNAYIEPGSAGLREGEFQWSDWDVPGAVVLAKTSLASVSADQVSAELWVYDVPGRERLGAKRFTANSSNARYVGHRIADEIILLVSGKPGIFTTRIAAVSKASGNKEIKLLDVDGHNIRSVTRNGSINLQPAWDSTGGKIAWTSYRSGNPDLYVADLANGTVRRVSSRSGVNIGAAFAPGQDLLALTLSSGARGDTDIFGIRASDGKLVAQLTKAPGIDVSPSFSPDGSQIVFASERSGGLQLYVMPTSGGDARRITFQGNHNTDPSWSPDGQRIAFVGRDGQFDVFTVRPDGSDMTRITQGEGSNEDPTWSPDSRYIAFSSTRSGGAHIWMSTADGRHQVQLTQSQGPWSNPAWSPGS
ncbi:MAG: Tol-Pal system beta propeller repeat protein TolB [Myxococcota bacterium]|nr:Tol-Pal system beta propeller repeat protein TolB [Myxococcota bacterium]